MELLSQKAESIQGITIQTVGRITECIGRLSQTLALMKPLIHSPIPFPKHCGETYHKTQLQQLFEGIEHSVKHMELLTLSVEQKFHHFGNIVRCFSEPETKGCEEKKRSEESTSCTKMRTIGSLTEDIIHHSNLCGINYLWKSSGLLRCSNKKISDCKKHVKESEFSHIFKDNLNKVDSKEVHSKRIREEPIALPDLQDRVLLARPEDIPSTPSEDTIHKIAFLEGRLTSWIEEIDKIDVRIEKSIETSKNIYKSKDAKT